MNAATRSVVDELRSRADPARKPGMARVGITVDRALRVSIPDLRRIARRHRRDHTLALELWTTEIHEARILASMVDDPAQVTREQMEAWVSGFDSWDLCDQVCGNLFRLVAPADAAARAWARRPEEYVRRAAFSTVAMQAVHDERADAYFLGWLPRIRRAATDDRNTVRKALSWSLRQIGKRNPALRDAAMGEAELLIEIDHPSARWIGRDALRELRGEAAARRAGARSADISRPRRNSGSTR